MSVFTPIDPRAADQRRRALAARLSGRMGTVGGSATGAAGAAALPMMAAFRQHAGAHTQLTAPHSNLPKFLADLLGPGAVGSPMPGEGSMYPGEDVGRPPGGVPRPPQPGEGDYHPMPVQPLPIQSQGGQTTTPPPLGAPPPNPGLPSAPTSVTPDPGATSRIANADVNPDASRLTTAATSGLASGAPSKLIPLGNGLFFDPANDVVVGGNMGGGGRFGA